MVVRQSTPSRVALALKPIILAKQCLTDARRGIRESRRGQYEIFVFDTYKGDDLERAFRPYIIISEPTYLVSRLEHVCRVSLSLS
eukprot:COSAG02_NODE_92_length_37588_cov_135.916242_9_plen_85_part_00